MSNSYEAIFRDSVSILDTYNEDYSPDFQVDEFYRNNRQETNDYVLKIVDGCVAYKDILNDLVSGFYQSDGKLLLNSEANVYKFFGYLISSVKEIGMQHIKNFIKCADPIKIYKFLKIVTNEKNINGWIKDLFIAHYDNTHVETKFINPIINALPEFNLIIKNLKKAIEGQKKITRKSPTRPHSFDLSEMRPKKILLPVPITETYKPNKVPKSLYETPKTVEELKQISFMNKQRAEQLLVVSKLNQPKCALIPEKLSKSLEDMEGNENKFEAKPPPKLSANAIPVKLNAATVLKQGYLYKKETEEMFKQLEELEKGAVDANEFLKWQTEMKNLDNEKLLLEIEKRKLKGKLSYEEAILSKERLADKNKKKANNLKEEKLTLKEKMSTIKLAEEQKIKENVDKVNKSRLNNKIIQTEIIIQNKKIAKEVAEESEQLVEKAIKQAEEEMQKKMELIQQIKAFESIPVIKKSFFDLTSTAGHSLLSEMSIAELKERIQLLQARQMREMEEKHDEIITNKLIKDKNLVDTIEFINTYKNTKSSSANKEKKVTKIDEKIMENEDIKNLNQKFSNLKNARKNQNKIENEKIPDSKKSQNITNYMNQRKILENSRIKDLEAL